MDFTIEIAILCLFVMFNLILLRIFFPVALYTAPQEFKIYPIRTAVRVSFPELDRYYEQAIVISTHYVWGSEEVWHRVLVLGEHGFAFPITIYDSRNITCWNESHVWEDWYEKHKETREWLNSCRAQFRGQDEMRLHGL